MDKDKKVENQEPLLPKEEVKKERQEKSKKAHDLFKELFDE